MKNGAQRLSNKEKHSYLQLENVKTGHGIYG